MITIAIKQGKAFAKGVANARKHGGKFDPNTKTWTLPATQTVQNMCNAPGLYGWTLVMSTPNKVRCIQCGTYCDGDCHAA